MRTRCAAAVAPASSTSWREPSQCPAIGPPSAPLDPPRAPRLPRQILWPARQVWSHGEAELGLDSMHTTSLGAAILTLRRPYNALFWWEVRFDVLVGSTSQVGSEGFRQG